MRLKYLLIPVLVIFNVSCTSRTENFTISGALSGKEGAMLFLKEMTTRVLIPVDSVRLDETGSFTLGGFTDVPKFFAFYISEGDFITLLIHPGDKISITGEGGNLFNTYQVQDSEDSQKIRELTNELNKTLQSIRQLSQIFNDSLQSPDFLKIKADLDKAYEEIISSQREYTFKFIRQNLNSLVSLMALYQQVGPHYSLLDPVKDFRYYEIVDSSLIMIYPGSEAVQELHRQVVELKEQKRTEEMTALRLGKGAEAPEIALPSPEGDTIYLSSLRGKYVLLDFWASWCQPCRVENPNLVKNYKKYNAKGFEIYQVSLDRTRSAWLKAIKSDQLAWIHVSDLQMWNSVVVPVYYIQGIPMNFLLDREGRIIDQNLRGEELGDKLKEIFSE